MTFIFAALSATLGLFFGMLLLSEVGRRIGIARIARDPDGLAKGSGPVEAAIFGLLGLLLAFTFSGAASRFEDRRQLIAEESNAIGTAYLMVQLLPSDTQPEIKKLFRNYLETRISVYKNAADVAATEKHLTATASLQNHIWNNVISACQRPETPGNVTVVLLPALNAMFDITTTRAVAMQSHPPKVIFFLLAGLSLISALLAGYVMSDTKVRSWFYMLLIATTMSVTFYVIIDLEYPRFGLIRIDEADQTLIDLRRSLR